MSSKYIRKLAWKISLDCNVWESLRHLFGFMLWSLNLVVRGGDPIPSTCALWTHWGSGNSTDLWTVFAVIHPFSWQIMCIHQQILLSVHFLPIDSQKSNSLPPFHPIPVLLIPSVSGWYETFKTLLVSQAIHRGLSYCTRRSTPFLLYNCISFPDFWWDDWIWESYP